MRILLSEEKTVLNHAEIRFTYGLFHIPREFVIVENKPLVYLLDFGVKAKVDAKLSGALSRQNYYSKRCLYTVNLTPILRKFPDEYSLISIFSDYIPFSLSARHM